MFGPQGSLGLDTEASSTKFADLTAKINKEIKQEFSVSHVAKGFLQVANESMAEAIKKISIQRGFDVRDHVLCCFGGAAGQHACAVADVLDVKKILIHPLASLLSAFGIGLSSLREIAEKNP